MSEQSDKREADRVREGDDVLRGILSTPSGRKWYWRNIERTGATRPGYGGDLYACGLRDGQRDIGFALMGDAQRASLDLFALAFSEQMQAAKLEKDLRAKEAPAEE
ncbi:MAG: hypothetical protein WC876_01820 [Candidatus Thermoplasmatota archaeon]|jgi:hypothetical protein